MLKNELLDALHWRYATKHFDPNKKISDEDFAILKQSLILSPSSFGLQPYKFLVVENIELRKKLTANSWNQAQIEEASHLVVFLGKNIMTKIDIEEFIELTAKTRQIAITALENYKNMMLQSFVENHRDILDWAAKQAYIALGNLMTAAALLKIDSCPMEGIIASKYDEILEVEKSYTTLCVCALGFRAVDDKAQNLKKVRFNEKKLIEVR
jgi:nitroreductase